VTDSGEESELDTTRSTALNLASRQSQLIEEIDDALRRIDDGTYELCAVCGKPIDEERLKAMPSARYDAACEATLERSRGVAEMPTL
jgi:DnaK suppressor protein